MILPPFFYLPQINSLWEKGKREGVPISFLRSVCRIAIRSSVDQEIAIPNTIPAMMIAPIAIGSMNFTMKA